MDRVPCDPHIERNSVRDSHFIRRGRILRDGQNWITTSGDSSNVERYGIDSETQKNTDASAAQGIAARRRLGQVRHIEVNQLAAGSN